VLKPSEAKRLQALISRNKATTIYYRIRGEDADKAFVTFSPSSSAPVM
jgi:hypothetical protein